MMRRAAALLGLLGSLSVAGGYALAWAAPPLPTNATDLEGLVAGLAAIGAWACLAWLALGAGATALRVLPGAAGRVGARLAERITPAVVRRGVELALGASVAATPAMAAPAALASGPPPLPSFDRPVATGPASPARAATPPRGPGGTALEREGRGGTALEREGRGGTALEREGRGGTALEREGPGGTAAPPVRAIVVRPGDTLWAIAARHLPPRATRLQIASTWPRWYTANRAVVGDDPDRLKPGQRLRPPPQHGCG